MNYHLSRADKFRTVSSVGSEQQTIKISKERLTS